MSLRKSLVLISVMLCAGCTTYVIPENGPKVTPTILKSSEQIYSVSDMQVKTGFNTSTVLTGQWHVVSSDFIKDHVRNQDDLIKALELLKEERKRNSYIAMGCIGAMVLLILLTVLRRR